jgi:peptidoglycan-associated lipoprotein
LILAGCSAETAKKSDSAAASSKSTAGLGQAPEAKAPASRQAPVGSSLDAHREGKALASGPLKEIYFDFDSYDLTSPARSTLQANAAWLKANPGTTIEIEGHCDERGTTEYNLALGAKRARAAMDYLVSLGIAPSCRDASENCYEKNRRDRFVEARGRPAS